MKRLFIITALLITAPSILSASGNGEALFKQKCASCHSMTKPKDRSKMKNPTMRMMLFQVRKGLMDDKEDIVDHINDFVLDPSVEKAVCGGVKRFGLMPSQKGKVTPEELDIIAHWLVDQF